MLEWDLSRGNGKLVHLEALSPIHDMKCFSELTWQGHPLSKKISLVSVRKGLQRGSAPAKAGDEWVAIRQMAFKRFG